MTQFENKEPSVQPAMVQIWSGDPANIPEGWGVCDGQNGTPDFRNRMPKATPNKNTESGATGGTNSKTLGSNQMPSHDHYANVENTGDHYHTRSTGNAYTSSPSLNNITDGTGSGLDTTTNGEHTHTMETDYAGSGNNIDNQPSYREGHYIMRL